ncbi:hypothetical protein EP7_005167 [Isosphaeraceae bacterium EP7]
MAATTDVYDLASPPRGGARPGGDDAPADGADPGPGRIHLISLIMTPVLCLMHAAAIWLGMGGWTEIGGDWPILRDDHGMHYHHAAKARATLKASWTTAAYDPAFMAGYARSIVSDPSATAVSLFVAAFGGSHPARAYNVFVLLATACVPYVVSAAARSLGAGPHARCAAVLVYLVYVWTDFPINYASLGMVAYFTGVPLGLWTAGMIAGYLERGGLGRWLLAAAGSSLVALVHPTVAMVLVPSALAAYAVAWRRSEGFPVARHAGVWLMPPVVLALNAFWWLPGYWLAATKGASDFVMKHDEGVVNRLLQIVDREPVVQALLIGAAPLGLLSLWRRRPVAAAALAGYTAAGFGWGYLAGYWRALDSLQPGRHTYAFYTALAVALGLGWSEVAGRLRDRSWDRSRGRGWRADGLAALAILAIGVRVFGPSVVGSVRYRIGGPEPFLSSRPSPRLHWVLDRVREHVKPGERLYYEESGVDVPGVPDPFRGRRYSGLLPERTGVEVIGGPYLHIPVATNFTQVGEGKLFGDAQWSREQFVKYARLYRPAAIVCWSPRARSFCKDNPDLVDVKDDDGTLLIGRVKGFGGAAIEGEAEVTAADGRLLVRPGRPGIDGTIVLRYHSVPCLRGDPPARWDEVTLEGDPVPFLRLRPEPGTGPAPLTLELAFPPG